MFQESFNKILFEITIISIFFTITVLYHLQKLYVLRCRHCTEFYPIWSELAELVNTKDSKFAIAQVDCTVHAKLCHENEITGT